MKFSTNRSYSKPTFSSTKLNPRQEFIRRYRTCHRIVQGEIATKIRTIQNHPILLIRPLDEVEKKNGFTFAAAAPKAGLGVPDPCAPRRAVPAVGTPFRFPELRYNSRKQRAQSAWRLPDASAFSPRAAAVSEARRRDGRTDATARRDLDWVAPRSARRPATLDRARKHRATDEGGAPSLCEPGLQFPEKTQRAGRPVWPELPSRRI